MVRSAVRDWWSRRKAVALLAAAAVVLGLVWGGITLGGSDARATPFPLAQMHARVTLTVARTWPRAQRLADRLAGRGRLHAFLRYRQVVGQLRFSTVGTADDHGQVVLFAIDDRSHTPLVHLAGAAPKGDDVASGWAGAYERLATAYPWLRPLAAVRNPDGSYSDPGESLSFHPSTRGPVTFTAALARDALPLTDPAREITFVIAYVGDDGVWAQRVPAALVAPARAP